MIEMSMPDIADRRAHSLLRVGGLFKHEEAVTARGRKYLRLTVGSGGAQCESLPVFRRYFQVAGMCSCMAPVEMCRGQRFPHLVQLELAQAYPTMVRSPVWRCGGAP